MRPLADTVAVIGTEGNGHAFDTAFNSGALREQLTDLRRTVLSGFDSQGDRLLADVRSVLQDLHPHPPRLRQWRRAVRGSRGYRPRRSRRS